MDEVIKKFKIDGTFIFAKPYGSGHINDTYAVYLCRGEFHPIRYTLQKINTSVFKSPEKVMENIVHVTEFLKKKIGSYGGNTERETLSVISTHAGRNFYIDKAGDFWRMYHFVDDATSYQQADIEIFEQSARAFGKFQKLLSDFPAEILHESIPDFHDTAKRYLAFLKAVDEDVAKRAASCQPEIEFVKARKADTEVLVHLLSEKKLPLRVTHNDTKLNNVLFDIETKKALCVIDLDTVMPGLSLYDFGDSIRFGASSAAEDEQDLSKVYCDLSLFEAYVRGYLFEAGDSLTQIELDYLAFSAKIMTLECGMRFLTDHLNGDTYFKIHRDNHNLDRCRTQLTLVADMEKKMSEMKKIVDKYR